MSEPGAARRVGLGAVAVALAAVGGIVAWNQRQAHTDPYYDACVHRLKQEFGAVQSRDLQPGSKELRAEPRVTRQPDGSYDVLGLLKPGGSFHCTVRQTGDAYVVINPYVD